MKDPYVYENTNILINLKNIRNQNKLDEYENAMTTLAITKLRKEKFEVNSLKDIIIVHKILFENVYEWAGKIRTINIYKEEPVLNGLSVEYSNYQDIKKQIDKLEATLKNMILQKCQKKN